MKEVILIVVTAIATAGAAYLFQFFFDGGKVELTNHRIIFNYLDSKGINVQSFRDIGFNLRFENKSKKNRVITIERVNFCDGEKLHKMYIQSHSLSPVLNIPDKQTKELKFAAKLEERPDVGICMVNSENIYVQIYFSVNGKEQGKTINGTTFDFNGIDMTYLT